MSSITDSIENPEQSGSPGNPVEPFSGNQDETAQSSPQKDPRKTLEEMGFEDVTHLYHVYDPHYDEPGEHAPEKYIAQDEEVFVKGDIRLNIRVGDIGDDPSKRSDSMGTITFFPGTKHHLGYETNEDVPDGAIFARPVYQWCRRYLFEVVDCFTVDKNRFTGKRGRLTHVGFMYTTRKRMAKLGHQNMTSEEAMRVFAAELDYVNMYRDENVYGYTINRSGTCSMGHKHDDLLDEGYFSAESKAFQSAIKAIENLT